MTGAEVLLGIVIAIAVVGCFAMLGPWKREKEEGTIDLKVKGPPLYVSKTKRTERKYGNDE